MINQRKRVAKRLASGLLAGALALGGLAISGSSPAGAIPLELERDHRISGADRYATAAAVADEIEDEHGIETLIVASGENFPDALAAAALTSEGGNDGAIVLVKANEIPDATLGLLNSVNDTVDQTYVVGGEAAISADVLSEIEDIMDNDVDRISGDDRYSTALEVADEVGYDNDTVIIVSGESWADAVTVGAYAASEGTPILLANASGLTAEVSAELEDRIIAGVDRAIIVGGSSVVSAGLEDDLIELGLEPSGVSRVAGPDRYITNLLWQLEVFNDGLLKTNKQLDGDDISTSLNGREVMLVTGTNFPDALAAAPFAAAENAHLILTNPSGGGAAALTIAGAAKNALSLDVTDFGIFAASAGLVDFGADPGGALNAVFGDSRILEEIWAIGGQSAVPDSVVTTMAAAASDSMDCIVIARSANDDSEESDDLDGPSSALTIFPKNLQQVYNPGWAGGGISSSEWTYGGLGSGGGFNYTELEMLRDNPNDYWDVEGATIDTALPLDLDADGFQDAMLTIFSETLAEGASVDFEGIEQESDIDKYTNDGDYYGLRELNGCSATVGSDANGPEAKMYAVIGDNAAFVQFNERMLKSYKTELDNEFGWSCQVADSAFTSYFCEGGANWVAGDTWELANDTYYDQAGNELDDSDLVLKSSGTYRPAVTDFTITCSAIYNAGMEEQAWNQTYWSDNSTGFDTATGVVQLSDNVTLTALSGVTGVEANEWTFTIVNDRGLIRPVVTVDGKDVTITIDGRYHDGDDIERAINSSSIGRGFGGLWSAVGDTDDLVEDEDFDFEYTTADDGGTEATQTCNWEATFSEPVSLYDTTATGATYNDATLSSGEFQILMDGAIVNDSGIGYEFEGTATEGGFVLSGTIQRTTSANVDAEIKWKWVTTSTAKAG